MVYAKNWTGIVRGQGSHWYTKSGEAQHDADLRVARKATLYPSVTTVDKDVFINPFLDKWKQDQILIAAGDNHLQPHENAQQYAQRIWDISMEKSRVAMEFGNKIHDAIENHPQEPEDKSLLPWFVEFSKWWDNTKLESVASEAILLDHDLGVAGKTDKIARGPNGRVVADWKTQDVKVDDKGRKKPVFYDSWGRQLAFYAGCDAKQSGTWPELPECISLVIDSNPGGLVYEKLWDRDEIKSAYKTFVTGAWLWFDKRGYWPVGQWDATFTRIPMPS